MTHLFTWRDYFDYLVAILSRSISFIFGNYFADESVFAFSRRYRSSEARKMFGPILQDESTLRFQVNHWSFAKLLFRRRLARSQIQICSLYIIQELIRLSRGRFTRHRRAFKSVGCPRSSPEYLHPAHPDVGPLNISFARKCTRYLPKTIYRRHIAKSDIRESDILLLEHSDMLRNRSSSKCIDAHWKNSRFIEFQIYAYRRIYKFLIYSWKQF